MSFAKEFLRGVKDKDTFLVSDEEGSAEFSGFIDSGSYALNALLSASIYGGFADNKVTMIPGEPSAGKTYIALGVAKAFQEKDPEAIVIYYDTEAAVTSDMMKARGVDPDRVILHEPISVQAFRTHAVKVLDKYAEMKEAGKKTAPLLIILDSLGQLSTTKELEDTAEGKETRDMTKASIIKATFRVITLKAAKAYVPILVTNHVYASMDMYSPKVISGGSGSIYSSSGILSISKSKDKDKTTGVVKGAIIRATNTKNRFAKENAQVELRLDYNNGLDRYYGLLPLAIKSGVFKKVSTKVELPDGSTTFGVTIEKNPEKYFTPEVLAEIEKFVKKEFAYGAGESDDTVSDAELEAVEDATSGD